MELEGLCLNEQEAETVRAVCKLYRKRSRMVVGGTIIIAVGAFAVVYPAIILGISRVTYDHLMVAILLIIIGGSTIHDARRNAAIYRLLGKVLDESERRLLSE